MTSTFARILWGAAVLIIAAALAITALTLINRPGNRLLAPPSDTNLDTIVRDIRPTLATIEAFRATTGTYPLGPADLAGRLPKEVIADAAEDGISFDVGGGAVWIYQRASDHLGYTVIRRLDDGGSLELITSDGRPTWLYTAADGDDAIKVALPAP